MTHGNASCAPRAPQGKGHGLWGSSHRITFPRFWVKEERGTILKTDKIVAMTTAHSKVAFTKGTISRVL